MCIAEEKSIYFLWTSLWAVYRNPASIGSVIGQPSFTAPAFCLLPPEYSLCRVLSESSLASGDGNSAKTHKRGGEWGSRDYPGLTFSAHRSWIAEPQSSQPRIGQHRIHFFGKAFAKRSKEWVQQENRAFQKRSARRKSKAVPYKTHQRVLDGEGR